MKLTIINDDKSVYEDGFMYDKLPLTTVPSNVHALQFDTVSNTGWIEFKDNVDGTKPQNELINSLPNWATDAMTDWTNADNAYKAQQAALLVAQEAALAKVNQPISNGTKTL